MTETIDLNELFEFINLAGKSTYAAGLPPNKISERKDFFEYDFSQGSWIYKDSFTGHTKSAGQEVVRFNNIIVWCNSYCGGMTEGNEAIADKTFEFLKTALSEDEVTFQSLRGPKSFSKADWKYKYTQDGSIENYYGLEEIYYQDKLVFFHRAIGGTIINS